jgi:hypothetical protein
MIPVVIIACWIVVVSLVVGLCIAAQKGDIARQREDLPRDANGSARAAVQPTVRARRSETGGLARIGPSAG